MACRIQVVLFSKRYEESQSQKGAKCKEEKEKDNLQLSAQESVSSFLTGKTKCCSFN